MPNLSRFLKPAGLAWRLLLVAALVIPVSLVSPGPPAEAGGWFSRVIPFAGLVGAFRGRNRIYRTANAYEAEKNELYDRYRAKANEMLGERQIRSLRDSQVSAFTKVVGLIEGERTAMEDYAESEKRAARERFHEQVEKIIIDRILASSAATSVLGALTNGIKSSQDFLDRAAGELAGGGGGFMADVQHVSEIAGRVSMVGGVIGGPTGVRIKAFGDRVARLVNKPRDEIQAGIEQVYGELGELGTLVEDLKERGVTLTPSEATREVLITLVTGEDADPEIAQIVDLLLGRAGKDGTFRSRARQALIEHFVARCARMGRRLREAINALNGSDQETSEGSTGALDLCTEIDLARIAAEAAAEGQEPGTVESEHESPAINPEDICALLPVDRSLVTDASAWACVAVIDPLLGCSGCNSRMSIALTDSVEIAQQQAISGSCGNPNFYARGDSPVGDAGMTCTFTGDDEYREGVAQLFFSIIFSYKGYVAGISAMFPGQDAYVLDLARQIVERIDRLPR
jgi:hypothetical protein